MTAPSGSLRAAYVETTRQKVDCAMPYDEATAERVRKILSGRRDVVEKKLMGGLCFMVKGAMCCSVSGKGGLLVRIGEPGQAQALGEPHVSPMEVAGRIMTGFVRVASEGYATDAALRRWIDRGVDFVATLPAKPSRRKSPREAAKRGGKK